ncbi:hypothetical protein PVAG01_03914 [Phlyctema vagabunda]|uniref:Uncharacterized protein n=1 Tax=Phlyctema vagabunda TaxID=108571 RepID=A0ABR4PMR8_9HELO
MASPLSDTAATTLNATSSTVQNISYEANSSTENTTAQTDGGDEGDEPLSSPFAENVSDSDNRENVSPSKAPRTASKSPEHDREGPSPLKLLKSRSVSPAKSQSPRKPSDSPRSPRKLSSPEKRFPIKVSASPTKRPVSFDERTLDLESVLRDNEGLTRAIQILEDESDDTQCEADDTITSMDDQQRGRERESTPSFDDTMVSAFSDFSAVPDMTMFAKIGHSPSKYASMGPTPRRAPVPAPATTPGTARRAPQNRSLSPTPRGKYGKGQDRGDTTNLILDFTEQINGFSGAGHPSPTRQGRNSPMKSMTMPDLSAYYGTMTPSANRHNMSNLLDFDIPPAPTPRSMPSITPRELESLKSSFLSEISSLKASLSGKEAEVLSLKTAVGDAETRVGQSLEQVREERDLREQLAAEKEEWEKRGREMEAVLRNVKEEIVHGEHERNDLEGRIEESERRREAAEMMAQEAESKMASLRAGKASPASPTKEDKANGDCTCGGRTVEMAVEKVSRELHTLYKEKHETKVSALKKSYERRWDKKIRELEEKVEDLSRENEDLRRDATMTRLDHKSLLESSEDVEEKAAREARTREMEAELEGLSEVVNSVKRDNTELRQLLDEERVEKSKLVGAVEEMIPVVAAFDDMLAEMNKASAAAPEVVSTPAKRTQPPMAEPRGSASRASGLRAPSSISGPGESRIGRGGFGHKATSSVTGISRPGSGTGSRSGIMSSIEKMGSYKGRGGGEQ